MIPARLQFGPFDGILGEVQDTVPLVLDVTTCRGCGCGRPVHYRLGHQDQHPPHGYHRYELVGLDDDERDWLTYRHADTLDPITEQGLAEVRGL